MKKYLVIIAGIVVLVGVIGAIKASQIFTLINAFSTMQMPPTVISATTVEEQEWEMTLDSIGTLEAAQGVIVTADIPGRVTEILFKAGAEVKAGDILIRQDISSESAQLRAAEANVALTRANLERSETLLQKQVASKAEYDAADARFKEAVAQADNIRTVIDKKTVKAPFDGRLGIRQINVGSDLTTGDAIVSLQAVSPIYVNFSLPQRDLSKLQLNYKVRIETDAVPGKTFEGQITTMNPEIDPMTRSLRLQGTLSNEEGSLLPGMYAKVSVVLPEKKSVLAVPGTAISYATYGDSIFKVVDQENEESGEVLKIAQQSFVRLGESRGDYVAIEAGVEAGETIVSTGVFKIQNGAPIAVNNDSLPEYSVDPDLKDS